MTLAEIALALDEPGSRPHGGRGMVQDDTEFLAERSRWKSLTPRQRLQERMEAR